VTWVADHIGDILWYAGQHTLLPLERPFPIDQPEQQFVGRQRAGHRQDPLVVEKRQVGHGRDAGVERLPHERRERGRLG